MSRSLYEWARACDESLRRSRRRRARAFGRELYRDTATVVSLVLIGGAVAWALYVVYPH